MVIPLLKLVGAVDPVGSEAKLTIPPPEFAAALIALAMGN
jgi:hypothetical protein